MTTELISKSKVGIEFWLAAISVGCKPGGEGAQIERVPDGHEEEIWYSGGQHFGSGGYSHSSVYAGNAPEYLGEDVSSRDGFISDSGAKFRLTAPSIVYVHSGDCIGEGRTFANSVTVCATDGQISDAVASVAKIRTEKSKDADLTVLSAYIQKCWSDYSDWEKQYVRNGTCWDSDGTPQYSYHPKRIKEALGAGTMSREEYEVYDSLRGCDDLLLAFRRLLYNMIVAERMVWFEGVEKDYAAKQKALRVVFARQQASKLQEMGFTTPEAWKFIHFVGVSNAVFCGEWVLKVRSSGSKQEIFQKMTAIARKTPKAYAAAYLDAIFVSRGLTPPPGGYQVMVKCMKAAQAFGLILSSVEIKAN